MNWLFPGFFAASALIGLPVLLHFLRSKPKTAVRFPSLRFLGESAIRDTRRHRLRRWVTLLLRCLVIALLAAAFARPFWNDAAANHRRAMVVAVDNSMSMRTNGRWDARVRWALEQLDELTTGDEAALLLMEPSPTWLAPMTDDLARVRSALQNARPGFDKTHYENALRVAGETLAASQAAEKTLVWMADEQRAGWLGAEMTNALPAGVNIRLAETAPAPKRQAAVVALKNNPAPHEGISATVRLFAPPRDMRQITVRAGKRILLERKISLVAGDNEIDLPFAWPKDADGLRVSLDPDDLPADDSAWIVPARSAGAGEVLLDTVTGPDFLLHALLATQRLGDGGFKVSPLPEKAWPPASVLIARTASAFRAPRVDRLDKFVDAGGPLWIFVNGSPEQIAWLKGRGVQVTERVANDGATHLRDWDPEHPILAAFAGQSLLPLLDVEFYRGFDLSGDTLVPLANWPDGKIALAEWSGRGRRVLLSGFLFDREATDWPARASFVPFAHQAVRWLGSFISSRKDWRIGDTIPLPGAGKWRALDGPAPQPERGVSGGVRVETPGLYEFASGSARKIFAVNIQPEESDLTPWPNPEQFATLETKGAPTRIETAAAAPRLSDEAAENQQRLWWWALAFCGAAILAELSLANRTAM